MPFHPSASYLFVVQMAVKLHFTPLYLPDSSPMLRRRTVKWGDESGRLLLLTQKKNLLTPLMEGV